EEIGARPIDRLPLRGDAVGELALGLQRDLPHEVGIGAELELQRGRHAGAGDAVLADQRAAFGYAALVVDVRPQRMAGAGVDVAFGDELARGEAAVDAGLPGLDPQRHHLRLAGAHARAAAPVLADRDLDVLDL